MARLIAALIRHGNYHQLPSTPSAHQPFPLNKKGILRSRSAAKRMKKDLQRRGWKLCPEIDSSRLLRAWQTAQIFSEKLDDLTENQPEITSFEVLAERGLGIAANLTLGQIEEVLAADPRYELPPEDWKSNSHYCLPLQGAESLMDAGERVASHINTRMQQLERPETEDRVKLFFGHGAAFRHAAHLMGVLSFDEIAQLSMYHGEPVYLEYLPDGSWRHIAGMWKVRGKGTRHID